MWKYHEKTSSLITPLENEPETAQLDLTWKNKLFPWLRYDRKSALKLLCSMHSVSVAAYKAATVHLLELQTLRCMEAISCSSCHHYKSQNVPQTDGKHFFPPPTLIISFIIISTLEVHLRLFPDCLTESSITDIYTHSCCLCTGIIVALYKEMSLCSRGGWCSAPWTEVSEFSSVSCSTNACSTSLQLRFLP